MMLSITTTADDHDQTSRHNIVQIVITVPVVIVVIIVLITLLVIVICCLRKHNRRYEFKKVRELPNVVLEAKGKETESEYLIDGMDIQCRIIDQPQPNGASISAIDNALYCVPDETRVDTTYRSLREKEDRERTPQIVTAINSRYLEPMCSQIETDPIRMDIRHIPAPQEPVDAVILYAIPNKMKHVDNSLILPEKSSEELNSVDADLSEYSEIGADSRCIGTSGVGPLSVPLTNPPSHEYGSSMSSEPLDHHADVRPRHVVTAMAIPQPQPGDTVLEADAIYAEPLPPSMCEPEWDPDKKIYESIYSEPLEPSLFMQERDHEVDAEDLHPYSSTYTCLLYTSPSPRDATLSRMPSSA